MKHTQKQLEDIFERYESTAGHWEWLAFKKPVHADNLGYWAWRGGALNYTEDKPK